MTLITDSKKLHEHAINQLIFFTWFPKRLNPLIASKAAFAKPTELERRKDIILILFFILITPENYFEVILDLDSTTEWSNFIPFMNSRKNGELGDEPCAVATQLDITQINGMGSSDVNSEPYTRH